MLYNHTSLKGEPRDTLFPLVILTDLERFTPAFSAHHFLSVRGFGFACRLLGDTRKCVTRIARVCFFVNRPRSSWARFLSQAPWTLPLVQQRRVTLLRAQWGDHLLSGGASLAWGDTFLVANVHGKLLGVQTWHDPRGNPDRGPPLVGHRWALAGLLGATDGHRKWTPLGVPVLAALISGPTNSLGGVVPPEGVARAMMCWDAVSPLIAHLVPLLGTPPLRVVAAASFSHAPCLNARLALSVQVITRLRKDARGWDDPLPDLPGPGATGPRKRGRPATTPRKGTPWKLASLRSHFPVESVTGLIDGKGHTWRIVTRDLWRRDVLQKVRLVVIKTTGTPLLVLSTDVSGAPEDIIQISARRFSLDTGIREATQHVGLGHSQGPSVLAMTRFVGLS